MYKLPATHFLFSFWCSLPKYLIGSGNGGMDGLESGTTLSLLCSAIVPIPYPFHIQGSCCHVHM
jgi:hypothetical protein